MAESPSVCLRCEQFIRDDDVIALDQQGRLIHAKCWTPAPCEATPKSLRAKDTNHGRGLKTTVAAIVDLVGLALVS